MYIMRVFFFFFFFYNWAIILLNSSGFILPDLKAKQKNPSSFSFVVVGVHTGCGWRLNPGWLIKPRWCCSWWAGWRARSAAGSQVGPQSFMSIINFSARVLSLSLEKSLMCRVNLSKRNRIINGAHNESTVQRYGMVASMGATLRKPFSMEWSLINAHAIISNRQWLDYF